MLPAVRAATVPSDGVPPSTAEMASVPAVVPPNTVLCVPEHVKVGGWDVDAVHATEQASNSKVSSSSPDVQLVSPLGQVESSVSRSFDVESL